MVVSAIKEFLRLESASGILLLLAAVLAMLVVNSPARIYYDALLSTPVAIQVGEFEIAKPLLLWINDGLMAVFFFVVGLEIKREFLEGELSDPTRVTLPVAAAIGGMAVPAAVYVFINWGDAQALKGWAIPSATDIAFALGVLMLLGNRVPSTLKLLLLTLAIIDDLGAIVIIALFYTTNLSPGLLLVAAAALVLLYILNRRSVLSIVPYILVGAVLWAAVLKSGVHATLAGVLLAFFIPLRVPQQFQKSPLQKLEEDLHPSVAYVILPLFAFANSGISFEGLTLDVLTKPVPLGIAAGLFLGKQIGIFGSAWLTIKLKLARLPGNVTWLQLYGVAVLCGIGFTMSLFISSLAFEQGGVEIAVHDRLGIMLGSLSSAIIGYLILNLTLPKNRQTDYPQPKSSLS